jgi:serine/threonine-protein kinase
MSKVLAFCVALLIAAPALAQNPEADRLFEEGRRLVLEGKYDEACPKFVEAQRLRPGVGTLLNLGDCYERQGKTASASRTFQQAVDAAEAAKDKRVELARSRVESLKARLVKLTIVVPGDMEGLTVSVDGKPFPRESWGKTEVVDPGSFVVSASAPGKPEWTQRVDALKGDVKITISFDDKTSEPAATPSPVVDRPVDPKPRGWSTQRYVAIGLAGVGAISMGVGAIFGSSSKSAHDEADEHCKLGPTGDQCDQTGFDASERAISRGNVATVLFVLGGAAVAGGAVVWFTAPDPKETARTRRGVALTPVGVRGVW